MHQTTPSKEETTYVGGAILQCQPAAAVADATTPLYCILSTTAASCLGKADTPGGD